MDGEALVLTLRLAATVTLLLMAVAIPLAWWIVRGGGWGARPGAGGRGAPADPSAYCPGVLSINDAGAVDQLRGAC